MSITSALSVEQRAQLSDDLNYLNMAEIKRFCDRHSIPYTISIRTADGQARRTRDRDRKGVVLNRIRHFVNTGQVLPETCLPHSVVCYGSLPRNLKPEDRLFYGQYEKANRAMIALLRKLTGGAFRNGAIARILAREFWSRGIAPTFREYADAWLQAAGEHTRPNPEWAFLSDRANKRKVGNWKELRATKATAVLKILAQV